jgi:hypothetical protein
MMKRFLALLGAAALALSMSGVPVAAQNDTPVNADGSYVVASDDGVPIVSGRGKDVVYGDINTGGGGGEVLGDPSAVYSPNVPNRDTVTSIPGARDGLIGGVPIPAPSAPDNTTTTTTNLATSDGNTTENIPIDSLGASEPPPVTTDSSDAVATGFCAQYGSWYDAQVAYENLGGTTADPALVQEVDPDYNGIACEDEMY